MNATVAPPLTIGGRSGSGAGVREDRAHRAAVRLVALDRFVLGHAGWVPILSRHLFADHAIGQFTFACVSSAAPLEADRRHSHASVCRPE